MDIEKLEEIIHIMSKGDTGTVELLFKRPGGRKHLESIVLVVIATSSYLQEEKVDLFRAFVKGLDKIEKRIKRQKEGEKILRQIYL